jgi:thiopeptide-type bacteriocin biosynthesis protein
MRNWTDADGHRVHGEGPPPLSARHAKDAQQRSTAPPMLFRRISSLSVVARVPLKPVLCALQAYATGDLASAVRRAFQDPMARAALFVATPSLYGTLIPALDANTAVPRRALLRALRYIVRMSTRCTPFGLFAAVSSVRSGESTELHIVAGSRRSRTRVDMSIIERLVSEIEMDRDRRTDLVVFTNDFAKRRGPATVIFRNSMGATTMQSQVVQCTGLLSTVQDLAAGGVTIAHLLHILQERLSIDSALANEAVDILLQSGVLLSSARSSLVRFDDAAILERYAAGSPSSAAAVATLTECLASVNDVPVIGQRGEDYGAIRDVARACFGPSDHYLQTDSTVTLAGTIGANVLNDAAFMAELLVRSRRPPAMAEIAKRFLALYEGDALVPLVDLEENAVFKDLLAVFRQNQTHGYTEEGNSKLLALLSGAGAAHREVRLTRDELLGFFAECKVDELPDALEVAFHVCAADVDALNRGEYVVVPASYPGSDGVGKTIGRFLDMMPAIRKELRAWHAARSADGATLSAELLFLPSRARSGNVCANARVLPYELQIGAHYISTDATRLSLSDLYVGVRGERFFLWSESLQCEVEPYRHDNLTLFSAGSDVLGFLALLRTNGRRSCSQFSLGIADDLPSLPRVRVDRIILVPARWRLPRGIVDAAALRKWRTQDAIPRFVWLSEYGDQKLLVDLESSTGQEQVCQLAAMTKLNTLVIEEAVGLDETWLLGTDGGYMAEFVVPLELASTARRRGAPLRRRHFDRSAAMRGPGDGWLFFKVYCDPKLQNYVLRTIVKDLLVLIRASVPLESWFFIRFADPAPHLRVRFRIAQKIGRDRCAAAIWERLSEAVKSGLLSDVSQSMYRRELERFGGLDGVEHAEHLFAIDSDLAVEEIALVENGSLLFRSAVEQAYHIIIALLHDRALREWLPQTASSKGKLSREDWEHVRAINSRASRPSPALEQSLAAATKWRAGLGVTEDDYNRFVNAVVHMHFNRFGIAGTEEERGTSLVWRLCAGAVARADIQRKDVAAQPARRPGPS